MLEHDFLSVYNRGSFGVFVFHLVVFLLCFDFSLVVFYCLLVFLQVVGEVQSAFPFSFEDVEVEEVLEFHSLRGLDLEKTLFEVC